MPVQILSYSTVLPNIANKFKFDDQVMEYAVGFQYFKLSYGDHDHHVRDVSLGLTSNMSGSTVSSYVSARLCDASGNTLDPKCFRAEMVCVAVIKSPDSQVLLANQTGIKSGQEGPSVPLPSPDDSINSAFVSGFNLSYAPDDHSVRSLGFTAGLNPSGTSGRIAVRAGMEDKSGHSASSATVDVGLAAAADTVTGLKAETKSNIQATDTWVDFGTNLSSAGAMISAYKASYGGDDHHVETISGGVRNVSIKGTQVSLDSVGAFINDDRKHCEDEGDSYVNLVVFAVPSSG